jgi:hypothetical protein
MAKTPPKKARGNAAIQVRTPPELTAAIDAEAERLSKERAGEPVSRSEVVRIILRRALLGGEEGGTKRGKASR